MIEFDQAITANLGGRVRAPPESDQKTGRREPGWSYSDQVPAKITHVSVLVEQPQRSNRESDTHRTYATYMSRSTDMPSGRFRLLR
jgi:hypothetical protein